MGIGTGTGTFASETTKLETSIHGHHLCEDLQNLLGNGLIVDRDQVLGLGIHLEGLVEGESGLDLARTCGNQLISGLMIKETSMALMAPN